MAGAPLRPYAWGFKGSTYTDTKTLANWATYRGEMVDGTAHGQGKLAFPSGSRHEGGFRDNRHGQGVYTGYNGNTYEGECCNDKWHGQGTYTWADGTRHEDEFCDGKIHGQGTYTGADGSRYEGRVSENHMHGHGTFTSGGGWSYTGDLNHNRPTQGILTGAGGQRFHVTWVQARPRVAAPFVHL